jgi:hypothetical protein
MKLLELLPQNLEHPRRNRASNSWRMISVLRPNSANVTPLPVPIHIRNVIGTPWSTRTAAREPWPGRPRSVYGQCTSLAPRPEIGGQDWRPRFRNQRGTGSRSIPALYSHDESMSRSQLFLSREGVYEPQRSMISTSPEKTMFMRHFTPFRRRCRAQRASLSSLVQEIGASRTA